MNTAIFTRHTMNPITVHTKSQVAEIKPDGQLQVMSNDLNHLMLRVYEVQRKLDMHTLKLSRYIRGMTLTPPRQEELAESPDNDSFYEVKIARIESILSDIIETLDNLEAL